MKIKMSIAMILTMTMIKIMIDKKMIMTTTTMMMIMMMIIALQNVEVIGQSLHTISLSKCSEKIWYLLPSQRQLTNKMQLECNFTLSNLIKKSNPASSGVVSIFIC